MITFVLLCEKQAIEVRVEGLTQFNGGKKTKIKLDLSEK